MSSRSVIAEWVDCAGICRSEVIGERGGGRSACMWHRSHQSQSGRGLATEKRERGEEASVVWCVPATVDDKVCASWLMACR